MAIIDISTVFPNAAALRAARPSDVGLAILKQLIVDIDRNRKSGHDRYPFNPFANLVGLADRIDSSPEGRAAVAEAIGWLMSHDLIVEHMMPGANSRGTLIPTRLGLEVAAAAPEANAVVYALRVIDLIPVSLRARVLPNLVSGEFDMAIAAAFKAVEVRMRERAGLSTSLYGTRLAKAFFARVTATSLQRAERKGQLADEEHLFEGLMGLYRDRAVHEIPHVDSMEYALEIIVSAAHLLRIVEAADLKP